MRRRLAEPAGSSPGSPTERLGIAHAAHDRTSGGHPVDEPPFEEHRRTWERRLSGRCRINKARHPVTQLRYRELFLSPLRRLSLYVVAALSTTFYLLDRLGGPARAHPRLVPPHRRDKPCTRAAAGQLGSARLVVGPVGSPSGRA